MESDFILVLLIVSFDFEVLKFLVKTNNNKGNVESRERKQIKTETKRDFVPESLCACKYVKYVIKINKYNEIIGWLVDWVADAPSITCLSWAWR